MERFHDAHKGLQGAAPGSLKVAERFVRYPHSKSQPLHGQVQQETARARALAQLRANFLGQSEFEIHYFSSGNVNFIELTRRIIYFYIDLTRKNATSHLGIGSGVRHCPGAPLARHELWWGFTAFQNRIEEFRLAPGKNQLRHVHHFYLRCLQDLHIQFAPRRRLQV